MRPRARGLARGGLFAGLAAVILAAVSGCATSVVRSQLSGDATYWWLGATVEDEKAIFSPADDQVTLTILFRPNFTASTREFDVRWIDPEGAVRELHQVRTRFGSNTILMDSLSIADAPSARALGRWQVRVEDGGETLMTREFAIAEVDPPDPECLARPDVQSYLKTVQARTLDRWELPQGVDAARRIVLQFQVDEGGALGPVFVVRSESDRLADSARVALEDSAPFGAMEPSARCLSRQVVSATFSNPLAP